MSVKLLAAVLLLIVIMVAVNALLVTQPAAAKAAGKKPTVLQGGLNFGASYAGTDPARAPSAGHSGG